MTRSLIVAILAFSLLILVNLSVFGYLGFRTLSEKMVTEKLVEGLNLAHSFMDQPISETDPLDVSRKLAPRLRSLSFFRAVVVLDRNGRVIHREVIQSELRPLAQPDSTNDVMRRISVPAAQADAPSIALEYNSEAIKQEVEILRQDFNKKLGIAIFVSLALLCMGLGYVIWAYRRNRLLREAAENADRLAYVGTLSSGLAHEIRNPLNSMNMNVQLVQEELDEQGVDPQGELHEMLDGTRREIHRLERLVSSFLSFARPTELTTKPDDVNALITNILEFLEPEIQACGLLLKTHLKEDLPKIPMDEAQLRQALLNVIQNSVQVLQPGQLLEITTRVAGGNMILIDVRDEGPGISKEELKNIFKVFYSTKRGGTGLGLPIAHRIAELHHGGIKVESEVGCGTTFSIILPMEPQQ